MKVTKKLKSRFWAEVEKGENCWLWTGPLNWGGYGRLGITLPDGSHKRVKAHRLSYAISQGYKDLSQVPPRLLHSCDTPACVNPQHLRPGTQKENVEDMIQRGRRSLANRILTFEQAEKIREEIKTHTYRGLAKKYGVSVGTVQGIVQRRSYKGER